MKTYNISMTREQRENAPFKEVGTQFQVKIVDLDKLIEDIRKERIDAGLGMQIQLVPSKVKRYHDPNFSPTYVKDPVTGYLYGIHIGWHPDGNPKWMKIQMSESMFLDLNKTIEAKMWAVLRMHPEIDVSPFRVSEPRFIVLDPEVEASKKLSRGTLISSNLHKVKTMKRERVRNFARWCDLVLVGDESPSVIRARLSDMAIDAPEVFDAKFNDALRNVGEIYRSAKQLGIVKFTNEKGNTYNDTGLGLTDFEAVDFLSRETAILSSMDSAIRRMDEQTDKRFGVKEEKEETPE